MTDLMKKPQPPADGECCDNACNPCVWDNYYAELKKWRLQQVELKAAEAQATAKEQNNSQKPIS